MSSWADESEDPYPALKQAPDEYTGGGGVRPRLQLKPRSAAAAQAQDAHPPAASSSSGSSKSNPFGAAKPREEVLASKGIDASLVDKRVERKASVARLTADQDRQVEGLRKELTDIEEKLREANEMELPEEDFRVAAEEKRNELNVLLKGFHDLNLKERNERGGAEPTVKERKSGRGGGAVYHSGSGADGSTGQRKFERPSERRRRLEQERQEQGDGGGRYGDYNNEGGGGGGGEDPFSSFGGRNNRGNRDRGGGRSGGGDRGGSYNDRDNRGSGGGGGGGYNDSGARGGGGRRSNSNYDDKYAGDRYNY